MVLIAYDDDTATARPPHIEYQYRPRREWDCSKENNTNFFCCLGQIVPLYRIGLIQTIHLVDLPDVLDVFFPFLFLDFIFRIFVFILFPNSWSFSLWCLFACYETGRKDAVLPVLWIEKGNCLLFPFVHSKSVRAPRWSGWSFIDVETIAYRTSPLRYELKATRRPMMGNGISFRRPLPHESARHLQMTLSYCRSS